ncbi:MAG: phosphosulfolactate synthase [Deltaproteobacteria bacterium]|nr:phosphosulfolactate synthase [Deltaproteobacteria bacterium]MBW2308658.1 phosphosulfolactate synthase [Deltaproteobacteria bacterium]
MKKASGKFSNLLCEMMRDPFPGRTTAKPRQKGWTFVIDRGMGLHALEDMIQTAGGYVDDVKIAMGTPMLYEEGLLREKIRLLSAARIEVMPGGTMTEVAIWQGTMEHYMDAIKELGFTAIEISDGTIDMDDDLRARAILAARERGFRVLCEVGKKFADIQIAPEEAARAIRRDLDLGAFMVVVEAREKGKDTILFGSEGDVREDVLTELVRKVGGVEKILWEAPTKDQQAHLIAAFGPDVNLGNILVEDVLFLEALRRGLRGDTLRLAIEAES